MTWKFDDLGPDLNNLLHKVESRTLRVRLQRLFQDFPQIFTVAAGAKHHHWWRRGLAQHITEMYSFMNDCASFTSITPDDCAVVTLLHDFPKVLRYRELTQPEKDAGKDVDGNKLEPKQEFTYVKGAFEIMTEEVWLFHTLSKYEIVLTDQQVSAIEFAEGGYAASNFNFKGTTNTADTVMKRNPLAVLAHMADMYSSQILGKSLT